MIYRSDEALGSAALAVVAVGTAVVKGGYAGYQYYETQSATNRYNAAMEVHNAEVTASQEETERKAGYAANLDAFLGDIDKERAKRYLIIGGAIGVPLLILLLSRKG